MMSMTVAILLALAGLSESAGRVLPLVARRPKLSPRLLVALMATATVVEGTVMALWPLAASTVAGLVKEFVVADASQVKVELAWTPALVAPLLFGGVLAFPLLGPFMHFVLVAAVGVSLAAPLAASSGLGWWTATCCIFVTGAGFAASVELLRRLIARIAVGARKRETTI